MGIDPLNPFGRKPDTGSSSPEEGKTWDASQLMLFTLAQFVKDGGMRDPIDTVSIQEQSVKQEKLPAILSIPFSSLQAISSEVDSAWQALMSQNVEQVRSSLENIRNLCAQFLK